MKIGIVGATGKAGQLIMNELIDRGHEPTAIIRNQSKLSVNVPVIEKDVMALTPADVRGFDVIVNAFGAPFGQEESHILSGRKLMDAVKNTDTRLIVIGGAGSLLVDDKGTTVLTSGQLPDFVVPTAAAQSQNFDELKASEGVNWTFISPAGTFDPEGRKSGYQLGEDHLLFNEAGESYVSYADMATAVADEIEEPKHIGRRFTIVGER